MHQIVTQDKLAQIFYTEYDSGFIITSETEQQMVEPPAANTLTNTVLVCTGVIRPVL